MYKAAMAALAAVLLAGCTATTMPRAQLPVVPADIQTCFRHGAVDVPQRALSVAEVEALWKKDRVRIVVMQTCGERFLAWYSDLQKEWR